MCNMFRCLEVPPPNGGLFGLAVSVASHDAKAPAWTSLGSPILITSMYVVNLFPQCLGDLSILGEGASFLYCMYLNPIHVRALLTSGRPLARCSQRLGSSSDFGIRSVPSYSSPTVGPASSWTYRSYTTRVARGMEPIRARPVCLVTRPSLASPPRPCTCVTLALT